MDVSDRRMQVQLTQEAKIVSDFYSIRAIFAFVGFVSALKPRPCEKGGAFLCAGAAACGSMAGEGGGPFSPHPGQAAPRP